jgi:biotin carboxyl carrier protein
MVEIAGEGGTAVASVVAGEHDTLTVAGDGLTREVTLVGHGRRVVVSDVTTHEIRLVHPWPFEASADDVDTHPASPLPGRVVAVHVAAGETVAAGQPLAVVEGMKMQHTIRAGRAGRIARVAVETGEQVDADAILFDIDTQAAP